MKQKFKYIFPIIVASLTAAGLVAAAFPGNLSNFQYGDYITEDWGNNLEATIGATNSTVVTSHDYLIKQATSSLYRINKTDGGFVVGDGTNFVLETGATARTSLGIGTTDYITALGFTGNASTADALKANGTNCSAGNFPLGIDASGNVESCSLDHGSNWNFISATAIRPTTTVGIIVSASSTISTLDISGGTVTGMFIYPSFTYVTSTWEGATTTIPLGPAFIPETWTSSMCFTTAGSVSLRFGDGTNKMNWQAASTTVGQITLNTNNTFTAQETRYVDIGSQAGGATRVSCTIRKQY